MSEFKQWLKISLAFYIAGGLVVGGLIAAVAGVIFGIESFGWAFLIIAPFLGGLIVFCVWWVIVAVKYVFDWATSY